MESKRKSFFNEIGFKPTIEKLVELTAKLYLEGRFLINIEHLDQKLSNG